MNTPQNTDIAVNTQNILNNARVQKLFAMGTSDNYYFDELMKDPTTIRFIDPRFRTDVICTFVMKLDSTMCKYFPQAFFCKETVVELLTKNGLNVRYIPGSFLNEEMYIVAVDNNVDAFKLVPPTFRTSRVCRCAFAKNPELFKEFPKSIKKEYV